MTPQEEQERYRYLQLKQKMVATPSSALPSITGKIGNFALKEGLPLAGMVGGEVAGGALGAATAPLTGPAGAVVGKSVGGGLGYGLGKEAVDQIQELRGLQPKTSLMSKVKDFPGQVARGTAYSTGGQLIGKGLPYLRNLGKGLARGAEALSGVSSREFEGVAANPRVILPKILGGAKSVPEANTAFRQTLRDAKIDPASIDFDKWTKLNQPKTIKTFVQVAERELQNNPKGVVTQALLKARNGVEHIMKGLPKDENGRVVNYVMRPWAILKDKIDTEIASREGGDKIAQAFADVSRAKMKANLGQILPTGKAGGYLPRRAALGLTALNPTRGLMMFGMMSPRSLSTATAAASAMPKSVYAAGVGGAVEALRKLRSMRNQDQ